MTDTVGFIHKLPHQLVDAFRATLEEVNRADVLIEVVDASDPHLREHRATVQTVLDELGAGDKPRLVAFNKADLVESAAPNGDAPAPALAGSVLVSALTGYGLDTLRAEIAALLSSLWVDLDVHVPYAAGELLARDPRAGHGRARVRRARRARPRPRRAGARGRARRGERPLGGDAGVHGTATARTASNGSTAWPTGSRPTRRHRPVRGRARRRLVRRRGPHGAAAGARSDHSDGVVVVVAAPRDGSGRRFAHLELSTAAGLLTLHPERDGTLHGNAVTAAGMRHVVGLPWPADSLLVVHGSPISARGRGVA